MKYFKNLRIIEEEKLIGCKTDLLKYEVRNLQQYHVHSQGDLVWMSVCAFRAIAGPQQELEFYTNLVEFVYPFHKYING